MKSRASEGRAATLEEARPELARDLLQARSEASQEAYYRRLRDKYAVRIEDDAGAAAPAG